MSSHVPVCVLAVVPLITSYVMGWRSGSTQTSIHTSVRRVVVRSWISLYLMEGKPSLAQDRAFSIEKETLQSHFDGNLFGVQPYLNARASWNGLLCKKNPCSLSGIALSHVEDPLSEASSTNLLMSSKWFSIKSMTASESFLIV